MKTSRRHLLFCVPATMAAASVLTAQETKVSPAATAEIKLKNKPVIIAYSRPYKKGRKIMGGLVPYGRVWRTGADDATSLKTAVDLEIGGTAIPAGSYTLYTLPSETTWKLIINKQTGQWGTEYDQSQDLARVDLTKTTLANPLEQFTIEFVKPTGDSADLIFEWETTKLSVPVRAK